MRFAAQKSIELQDCLPAQRGSSGLPILGSGKAISAAVHEWERRRGLKISSAQWQNAHHKYTEARRKQREAARAEERKRIKERKAEERRREREARPKVVVKRELSVDAKLKEKERKAKYRADNKDKIREEKRLAAQRRRDAMTPEQKKAESKKIQEYNRLRKLRQQAQQAQSQ
jgi:hypothetical protein